MRSAPASDGVVVLARDEALHELRQRLDAQPSPEMVVQRRHRLSVEHAVVGQVGVRDDGTAAGDVQVDPAGRWVASERGNESPGRSGRAVALPDVGKLHGRATTDGITGRV